MVLPAATAPLRHAVAFPAASVCAAGDLHWPASGWGGACGPRAAGGLGGGDGRTGVARLAAGASSRRDPGRVIVERVRLLSSLWTMSFRAAMQYRANFVMLVMMGLIY